MKSRSKYERLKIAYMTVLTIQIATVMILSTWLSRTLGTIAGIPVVVAVLAGMWTLGDDLFD